MRISSELLSTDLQNVEQQNTNSDAKATKNKKKGTCAAILTGSLAQASSTVLILPIMKNLSIFSKNMSSEQIAKINQAADDIISKTTNLGEKGVKFGEVLSTRITKLPITVESIINPNLAIEEGLNAGFVPKTKNIFGTEIKNLVLVNRDKLPLASFHELGHAYNYNNSAFWAGMQKCRNVGMAAALFFALIPAFTKEVKAEDGKELTTGQKINNGLRKASPLLALGSMVPMLAEEAMASIRGCKMAKPLLEKGLYRQVVKTNAFAYTSYSLVALGFAFMAYVCKKVKDKRVDANRQQQEQLQVQQQVQQQEREVTYKNIAA